MQHILRLTQTRSIGDHDFTGFCPFILGGVKEAGEKWSRDSPEFIATTVNNLLTVLQMSPQRALVLAILLFGLVGFGTGITVKRKRARRKA
ncbi:MAG: hypothetical protein JRF50_10110 [Deltaproteobacteria bacterium]|nr:hypothetical protein [Deltaproteobacteria bacterium]